MHETTDNEAFKLLFFLLFEFLNVGSLFVLMYAYVICSMELIPECEQQPDFSLLGN